ncbi:3' terminal RNA ribose 2'-O-methyltransferase Hen1 [Nocardia yamanashiensis]|uniref:3' terminal RNA ribose 2'-O-methyltransferase Hen1 n=1 Tax=Nocardia yamanashiensis TaxID=209247 RepID=UPI00082957F6|nr:3' terminal RNA ribose 2'-O-methyltransferase Hen1 [Nocardia yamanashiensis]
MLLTISCTRPEDAAWEASDLGFLLHKNPARMQQFEQSYGVAQVFYPEAGAGRCTAALLLEIDPVRLVRGKSKGHQEFSLGQYVNDRPYAASSLLAVAISTVFGSALHGRCKQRPELAETALPLHIELPAVPCKGGPESAERVFAPLGWQVTATPLPLDPAFPEWGDSHYVAMELTGTLRLSDALSHLYVLLPVLDGSKHYFLDETEIDKLLRVGETWLPVHPEREWITRRYLTRRHSLVRTALARLAELDDTDPEELGAVEIDYLDDETSAETAPAATARNGSAHAAGPARHSYPESLPAVDNSHEPVSTWNTPVETAARSERPTGDRLLSPTDPSDAESASGVADSAPESGVSAPTAGDGQRQPSLAVLRKAAVIAALRATGAARVLDLGCGEGALLRELVADRTFAEIVGVDVSMRALHIAQRRLRRLPEWQSRRVTLRQGALTYTDASLRGFDAAVLMEVIEHVDQSRLSALEHAVFGSAAPGAVIVTTPNGEYNALYEGLAPGTFRHADHRFEWSRAEFAEWAHRVAATYGYRVRFEPVGAIDEKLGAPTQLAVFGKGSEQGNDSDEKGAA